LAESRSTAGGNLWDRDHGKRTNWLLDPALCAAHVIFVHCVALGRPLPDLDVALISDWWRGLFLPERPLILVVPPRDAVPLSLGGFRDALTTFLLIEAAVNCFQY
jgi:hypothetical protein